MTAKREQTLMARRQDLVEGTIRSIAALGYSNSTVQTICEAANVSRGLIGHYFDSKDALLIEAFRHLCEKSDMEMRAAIRAAGNDPLDRLLAATRTTFQSAAGRDNALVWMALCGVAPWNPAMSDLYRQLYKRYRTWIEHMITRAARDRGMDIDARRAALHLCTDGRRLLDGLALGPGCLFARGCDRDRIRMGAWSVQENRWPPHAASRSHSRQQTQTEKEKVSVACSGMIFSPATES